MQFPAASNARSSKSNRRHMSLPFSSMLASGMILAACRDGGIEAVFQGVMQVDRWFSTCRE